MPQNCFSKNSIKSNRAVIKNYSRSKPPRWSLQIAAEMDRQQVRARGASIVFGEIVSHAAEEFTEFDLKSVKDRPPTPVV